VSKGENPVTVENFRFEELQPDLWPAFERLFDPNGACGGCWCMWWRVESQKNWKEFRGDKAKETFKSLIQKGKAHGMLAFSGDEPVGWCSFGPRIDFPCLARVRAYKRDDISDVWSVTCFFIDRKWRGKGLARGLLRASVEMMKKRGVKIVEGYPMTTTRDGRRLSAGMIWRGPLKIFEELGFKTVQSTNPFKPLVRLEFR
jgi:GNAT superfamily N-acetyltransferase